MTPGEEKRLLTYLQPVEDPRSLYSRAWSKTDADAQRQFATHVPLNAYENERTKLVQYLQASLGLTEVESTTNLERGSFYIVSSQSPKVLRMAKLDAMPYQLLVHASDQERVMQFVSNRLQKLQDVQVEPAVEDVAVAAPNGGPAR